MPRIEPLTPPPDTDVDRALRRWMPPGSPHDPPWPRRPGSARSSCGRTQSAWDALHLYYDEPQLLELLVLTGWYRTISYLANGLLLEEEPWGVRSPTG